MGREKVVWQIRIYRLGKFIFSIERIINDEKTNYILDAVPILTADCIEVNKNSGCQDCIVKIRTKNDILKGM